MKKGLILMMLLFTAVASFAQKVSGVVTSSSDGLPLPGVTVLVKGTTTGTITGLDGDYSINAPSDATLVYSFIGFTTQEQLVDGRSSINVVLEEESAMLEDLVVVGYGVQKKSVVTAAISKVTAEDLAGKSPVRIENALKGMTSGVTITQTSGQPGAASQIRVRGIGTINNSDPIYIVDGMAVEGIDYLNPNDIESIEVLKDAASGAVYGARAANGVILVTTKKGVKGKSRIMYDFTYGLQNPWHKVEVLNAAEYKTLMNENAAWKGNGPVYADPFDNKYDTDWQEELFNKNAPIQSHQLSVSGANDAVGYFISAGYNKQEGIVGGNFNRSNYERISVRSNINATMWDASEERNFLHKGTIGVNASYSHINSRGINTNDQHGGSELGIALLANPCLPVMASKEDTEAYLADDKMKYGVKNSDGEYYYIIGDYGEVKNPLAMLALPGGKDYTDKVVANFFAELSLWDNIKFRSSFGADLAYWGSDSYSILHYLNNSGAAQLENNGVTSQMNRAFTWQLTNILSYDKQFDLHGVAITLGQEAKKKIGRYLGGSRKNLIDEIGEKANLDFCTGTSEDGKQSAWGSAYSPYTMASLFGRLSYNFDERYMAEVTVRRDGSSNFGPSNKYAVFPSVSVGWNVTREAFMDNRPEWLSNIKLRASWGKNGNENIAAFQYAVLTSSGNNYSFGNTSDRNIQNGVKPSQISNPAVKWEESEQLDLAADFGFIGNALTFTVDYYKKKTNGMLMTMPIPTYVGDQKPSGNVGDMENSGIEMELGYKLAVGGVKMRFNGNVTYLKNKLIKLGNADGFVNLDSKQSVGTITRGQNGLPYPFFYGYKTAGIFQNQAEVDEYKASVTPKDKDIAPGDIRFVDVNNDGVIDTKDQTKIGKGMPDWTFGFGFNAEWKGIDLSLQLQGVAGCEIYDATVRTDRFEMFNSPKWMLERWVGEGSSNKVPRYYSSADYNWVSSDLYVKDGAYMRVKNVQLGYTLPKDITQKAFIQKLRVFAGAENLLTFTKYTGYDPEINSNSTSLGVDYGCYPQARVFNFGLNVEF